MTTSREVEQYEREALADVISRHSATHDGRSHWRPERYCRRLIQANGASPEMAARCTDAAIRVGEHIHKVAGSAR